MKLNSEYGINFHTKSQDILNGNLSLKYVIYFVTGKKHDFMFYQINNMTNQAKYF